MKRCLPGFTTAPCAELGRRDSGRRGWPEWARPPRHRRSKAAVLIPAIVVMALVGAAVAWGGAFGGVAPTPAVTTSPTTSPSSSPDATASEQADGSETFIVPFTYAIPAGSGLVPAAGGPDQRRIAWVVGDEVPTPSQGYGGQAPDPGSPAGSWWRLPSGPGPTAPVAGTTCTPHRPPCSTIWPARPARTSARSLRSASAASLRSRRGRQLRSERHPPERRSDGHGRLDGGYVRVG